MKIMTTIGLVILKFLFFCLMPVFGVAFGYGAGILFGMAWEFMVNEIGIKFMTIWPVVTIEIIGLAISITLLVKLLSKFMLVTSDLQSLRPQIYLKHTSYLLMLYFGFGLGCFFIMALIWRVGF